MKRTEHWLNRRGFLTVCGGVVTGQCITNNLYAQSQSTDSTGGKKGESIDENKKKELVEKAYKLGFENLSKGIFPGCALCTLAAVQDTLNMRDDTVFKAASGLSGGGGRTGLGNCGGFTGGALVIGQLCGCDRSNMGNKDCYNQSSRIVALEAEEFKRGFGSVICRDVQVRVFGRYFDFNNKEDVKQFWAAGASEKCANVVGKGAQFAVKLILDEGLVKI